MTLDPKEIAQQLAKTCADMVDKKTASNEEELSEIFVLTWNRAIKLVTPLEFCRLICDELTKGTHDDTPTA